MARVCGCKRIANSLGGEIVASGLRFLLQSLTPNARGIFKVLAEHQLANPKEGLPYRDFFNRCRDKFLVTNETTMRAQLNEFKDHKVIISKKSVGKFVFICVVHEQMGIALLSQLVQLF